MVVPVLEARRDSRKTNIIAIFDNIRHYLRSSGQMNHKRG